MDEFGYITSAAELQKLKRQPATLPPSWGLKASFPSWTEEEQASVESLIKDHAAVLNEERVVKRGNLSVGIWVPEKAMIKIEAAKGTHWNHFGVTINSVLWAAPEEALFLLEQGSLELYYGGMPLTLQQAFSILLPHMFTLDHYIVYAYLLRLGFIVVKHHKKSFRGSRQSNATADEKGNRSTDVSSSSIQVSDTIMSSPAACLWKDESGCKPLLRPSDARSTAAVLSKLQVVKTQRMTSTAAQASKYLIAFDVYQPGSGYKKTTPGSPYICICICRFLDPVPSLTDITHLTQEAHPTPVKFAVVSGGNVSIYSFLDADLPTFVSNG
ncbi:predicted protein [Nematostella vectensis]|uniref:tRNA-splicing endonuclease subunit Sen54 N-terminal domain-containing protein n=1 Tax=Nematostella vectensis TaxID=45351 RepID=A7RL81_NEMVE|nr:predicted protein [Nematostella vectensis]|eukprot:XP_001639880.1 predicted protein [Nematostella vectensis]